MKKNLELVTDARSMIGQIPVKDANCIVFWLCFIPSYRTGPPKPDIFACLPPPSTAQGRRSLVLHVSSLGPTTPKPSTCRPGPPRPCYFTCPRPPKPCISRTTRCPGPKIPVWVVQTCLFVDTTLNEYAYPLLCLAQGCAYL